MVRHGEGPRASSLRRRHAFTATTALLGWQATEGRQACAGTTRGGGRVHNQIGKCWRVKFYFTQCVETDGYFLREQT